jgi:hypothetical protein
MEGYQMFQSGDIPQLLERCHDDALWIEPEVEHVPFSGLHKGKAATAQFFKDLDTAAQASGPTGLTSPDRQWPGRRCTIEYAGRQQKRHLAVAFLLCGPGQLAYHIRSSGILNSA